MAQIEEQVSNKQVLATDYITGNPKQTDMYLKTSTISLQLPFLDASEAVLVKNLVLSCDPYMRGTKRTDRNNLFYSFSPDSVSTQLMLSFFFFFPSFVLIYFICSKIIVLACKKYFNISVVLFF
jgi:NADPH-dependent curcumin reductase CurA